MANEQPTTRNVLPDSAAHLVSALSYPGTGSALLISAVVHAVVLLILSLIVLTSVADISPVVTVLFDDVSGDAQAAFEETPDIIIESPPASSSAAVSSEAAIRLTEYDPQISGSFVPSETAEQNTASNVLSGNGDGADPQVVSMIQDRVATAGGRKGEVQFALAWKNANDIDLHVIAPSGERISHNHKRSQCQGELDVDMNVQGESEEPVENVRWLRRQAPTGRYTVIVNMFKFHAGGYGRGGTKYQLLVNLGHESEIVEGSVGGREGVQVHRFQYVPQSVPPQRRQQLFDQLNRRQANEEENAQVLLDRAVEMDAGDGKQRKLQELANRYPHTDAAIEALKLMTDTVTKS